MVAQEAKQLKRIYIALWAALVILLLAQVYALLADGLSYLIGAAISLFIVAIRYVFMRKANAASWKKALLLLVFLLTIFGPAVFVVIKLLFFSSSIFSLQNLAILLSILPIGLLFFCIRSINKLLAEQ